MNRSYQRIVFIALLLFAFPFLLHAGTRVIGKVLGGDFVQLEGGFKAHVVGVITPAPDEKGGEEAFDFAKKTLEGKRVVFSTWTLDNTAAGIVYDENNIAFASIEYGDPRIDFGEELLKRGLGRVNEDYLPDFVAERYRKLEAEAREAKVGIWAIVKR